ncbi:putative sarcosine oxidase protein [Phaeoacremonium minimum UCRPA7]|uniref:Putative sarcosine oxidase protein n=1 Tax=Phaeoacremonium minimum (strain UCR-PA7) TaxID=1286976 RepID=R8BXE4_PHAM7|nr:putative sarcosine oxidase protein [Phaeoacremonium minimum UCRPA7]EOO03944.1 putative sarcosine oxidase protein [Phaeoacremonium minimum UCRPA7]
MRKLQFVKGNTDDQERIDKLGENWSKKYHVVDKFANGDTNGFLDTAAGITLADKACTYARHLCEQEGVKFVLGEPRGKLQDLIRIENGTNKKVTGIKTCDGLVHQADLVIVACGPWTSAVIPEAHKTVEATMGTVMFIDIPEERKDLRKKFHPDNMPLCWYTDTIDNDYVKNQLERKHDHFTEWWKWRAVEEGKPCNGLEEGEFGPREMSKLELARASDFKFTQSSQAE